VLDLGIQVHAAPCGSAAQNVVLSTLGVPYTRKPINIYSDGIRNVMASMSRHGVKRLAVVSSSATEPHDHADGGFLLNRVIQPLVTATIGKTTYSGMRPELHEDQAPGVFTSRADLAASLLEQANDARFIRKAVAVTTSDGVPTLFQMIRREAFKT
jgi:hypothetical protein